MTVIPFIDPVGFSAADLIDEAGLSGTRQGAAQLSSTFPNFLVLGSGATSGQVIALLEKVRSTVAAKSGVQLQLHLKIW
jgi:UDP-N-acetylmuramate dehydrogenase